MTLAHIQQIKNGGVLGRGQGIFEVLEAKDFKMYPQGKGRF